MTLLSGTNITEGFGLAYRIIQDFNLNTIKVYSITAKYLASHNRLMDVEQLVECIRSNSDESTTAATTSSKTSSATSIMCDELLSLSVHTAIAITGSPTPSAALKTAIDQLIRHVSDVSVRINCHIASGQLRTAYLLAVQHNRMHDVRKVMRHAELTNQPRIQNMCERKLNMTNSGGGAGGNSNSS